MQLLCKDKILDYIDRGILFIDPLLEKARQVNAVTVDLRLGYDFLVSIVTRKPKVSIMPDGDDWRDSSSFYQSTRRDIGEGFILYPNQAVLTTTLEYVALPDNVYADVLTRSSFNKLGINVHAMIQPGFRGCFPLELFNHSNNPIELIIGCRLVQCRFFEIMGEHPYHQGGERKYSALVRPVPPKITLDGEMDLLKKCRCRHAHRD